MGWWFMGSQCNITFEPPHDKTNKLTMHPAKTQISLGMCPIWSESLLCSQWVAEDPVFLHADCEDSDQTGRMSRLIWVFGRTCNFVGFVMRRFSFVQKECTLQCDSNLRPWDPQFAILTIRHANTSSASFRYTDDNIPSHPCLQLISNSADPDQTAPLSDCS